MPLRTTLVLAALVATSSLGAGQARADVLPPSLTGETLTATLVTVDQGDCAGGFTLTMAGIAAGPYTGTFTASVSVAVADGHVTSFTEHFDIAGDIGNVSGDKALAAPAGIGACTVGNGFTISFQNPASYTAQIDTSAGSFQDTGTSVTQGSASEGGIFAPVIGSDSTSGDFTESFQSTTGIVTQLSTGGHVTGGGWFIDPLTAHRVSFGFEIKGDPNALPHATCTVIDHTTKEHVRCLGAVTLVVTGKHAYFSGKASVDGGMPVDYRIDVDDIGEPGVADTFAISAGGFVRGGVLSGGNIQIHN